MAEDIISTILRVENDYHYAIRSAVEEAEKYAVDCRKKQGAYHDKLHEEFHAFEKEEREKFDKTLSESLRKMSEENAASKKLLKACQEKKAGIVSERLMKEVLGSYGDN